MDNLFENDFKSHAVDNFRWSLQQPIAPGDLERFVIRNTGGGFLGSDWKMAALNRDRRPGRRPRRLALRGGALRRWVPGQGRRVRLVAVRLLNA